MKGLQFVYAAWSFAAVCFVASSAQAEFTGGVERFNGTTLDTSTWATSVANPSPGFSQNNAFTITAFDTTPAYVWGAYTTKAALVPVGGSVWAEVRVDNAGTVSSPTFAKLILTLDPSGSARSATNNVELSMYSYDSSTPAFRGVVAGESKEVDSLQTSYGPVATLSETPQPLGVSYIWQIERLTSTVTRFSLFSQNGPASTPGTQIALVGSGLQSFVTSTADMYVMLEAVGTTTTFDTITINQPIAQNQTTIPEPSLSSLLLLGGTFVSCLRRNSR